MQSHFTLTIKTTKQSSIENYTSIIGKIVRVFGGDLRFFNLPTQVKRISVYSSPHVYKRFKDHFEVRAYKRVIVIKAPVTILEILPSILKRKPFEINCKIKFNKKISGKCQSG